MSVAGDIVQERKAALIAPEQSSLRDILTIIFRNNSKIVLFFLFVVGATVIATLLMPNVYQSDAVLLIRIGRQSVAADPSVIGPTLPVNQDRENEINSELAILKSNVLAEKAVEILGATSILKGQPGQTAKVTEKIKIKAMATFLKNITVTVNKKSNIINVSYESTNPEFAQTCLETLIELYLEHHIQVHSSQASPGFFEQQAATILTQLKDKEDELQAFKTKNNITSLKLQKEKLQEQISNLQIEIGGGSINAPIEGALAQISATRARIAELEKTLKTHPTQIDTRTVSTQTIGGVSTNDIKRRLLDLQLKEVDLMARYPDDYRPLQNVREQIRIAQKAVANENEVSSQVFREVDPNYLQLKLELDNLRIALQGHIARKDSLMREMAERKRDLTNLSSIDVAVTRLEHEIELLRKEYTQYRENLLRANINSALDKGKISNVNIVEPPSLPFKPIKPKIFLNIALGIFFGLFGGVGLAFIMDYFDDSLKSIEDVKRRLGLPVLASISESEFEACTGVQGHRRRFALFS